VKAIQSAEKFSWPIDETWKKNTCSHSWEEEGMQEVKAGEKKKKGLRTTSVSHYICLLGKKENRHVGGARRMGL